MERGKGREGRRQEWMRLEGLERKKREGRGWTGRKGR